MSGNATREVVVRVHEENDGSLWAEVLDLPGCFASGRTLDELREPLGESIALYVTDDADAATVRSSDPPRQALEVGEMRVRVPV